MAELLNDVCLKNEWIEARIHLHGAELASLKRTDLDREYLWNADPSFWNRSSPVLFPFVGSVRDKVYRHEGREYAMGQHGFARDMDFTLISKNETEAWFSLDSNEETLEKFPLEFHLEIGYVLEEKEIRVCWKVTNPGQDTLYFSIGAHPAFLCPIAEGTKQNEYAFCLMNKNGEKMTEFENTIFGTGGLVRCAKEMRSLEEGGLLPIRDDLFDGDALVIEENQVGAVAILDANKHPYLTVHFDSPLVGIWSPPKKHAPFVCIEPWYGRCDNEAFTGELKDREWNNILQTGEIFEVSYSIAVD